jgi:hypothetical protein
LQGDIYYQKNRNQNKNKAKHYAQEFFKERKQVFHKKPKKKNVPQKNQQTKKTSVSLKN